MSDSRLTRRSFLTMLGVLVGAGAAGGAAWLRSDEATGPSTTDGAIAEASGTTSPPATAATSTAPTAEVTSTTESATTTASSTTTEATTTTTTEATTTTETAAAETTTTTASEPPETTTTSPPASGTTSAATSGAIEAICPEAWGAAPVQGEFVGHQIERLTVHHTAVRMDANQKAPGRMRSYQGYHQEQGWPDIAYHYLIDANGNVYEGRPVTARGDTFTEYDPTGHFLVCCDGHFDQQQIPGAQLAALVDVLAWAAVAYGVDPSTIAGHREYASTTCPGASLASFITDGTLRGQVEERINGGGVSLARLCGPAGLERVADIEAGRR